MAIDADNSKTQSRFKRFVSNVRGHGFRKAIKDLGGDSLSDFEHRAAIVRTADGQTSVKLSSEIDEKGRLRAPPKPTHFVDAIGNEEALAARKFSVEQNAADRSSVNPPPSVEEKRPADSRALSDHSDSISSIIGAYGDRSSVDTADRISSIIGAYGKEFEPDTPNSSRSSLVSDGSVEAAYKTLAGKSSAEDISESRPSTAATIAADQSPPISRSSTVTESLSNRDSAASTVHDGVSFRDSIDLNRESVAVFGNAKAMEFQSEKPTFQSDIAHANEKSVTAGLDDQPLRKSIADRYSITAVVNKAKTAVVGKAEAVRPSRTPLNPRFRIREGRG